MKSPLIILALLASAPAMASCLNGDQTCEYPATNPKMAQNQSPMGQRNSTPHAAPTAYEESASSCSTDGMKTWRACHICQTGRWYDIKEYECTAEEEARQERERARR